MLSSLGTSRFFPSIRLGLLWLVIIFGLYLRFYRLNHGMWYDESGQFWIAQGLNHYIPSFSPGSLSQILINNRQNNLDPPLFSLLLHLWSKLSTTTAWLRLLPSIFGLVAILYLHKLFKLVKIEKIYQTIGLLFALTSYSWVYFSLELRAYSLSLLISTALVYYFLLFFHFPTPSNYRKFITLSLLSLTALYSLWLLIPPIFILILLTKPHLIKTLIPFLISVIIFVAVLFFTQMKFQIAGFNLGYTNPYLLSSYRLPTLIFKVAQFNIDNLRFTFGLNPWFTSLSPSRFLVVLTVIPVLIFLPLILRVFTNNFKKNITIRLLFLFYLILLLEINTLSILGKFPIGPNRWNLFHTPLLTVLIFSFTSVLHNKYPRIRYLLVLFWFLIIINNGVRSYLTPRFSTGLQEAISSTNLTQDQYYIFSYDSVPSFKYYLYQSGGSVDQYYYDHHEIYNFSNSTTSLKKFLSQASISEPLHIVAYTTNESDNHLLEQIITNYVSQQGLKYKKTSSLQTTLYTMYH